MTGIVLCCIMAYLAVYAALNFGGLKRICNSDVYADMQVALRMWEQKTLFPQDWSFGNQLYVIATPVLAALLYGITENMNIAMALATELMTVFILMSFVWLLSGFTKDKLSVAVCCLLLVASCIAPNGFYSLNSLLFYTQASFYACYLITMFVVMGDYIRSFDSEKTGIGAWGLSVILCFATGMQSMRQTVVMVLPILVCEAYLVLRRIVQRRSPWDRTNYKSTVRAATYAISNVAGLAVIKQVEVTQASIYGQMKLVPFREMFSRMKPITQAFMEISSMDYVLQDNRYPKLSMVIVFMVVLVIIATILWLARIKRDETKLELCWLLCVISIVGVLMSTVVLEVTLRSIYIFMWFPLVAFSGLILMKKLPVLLKSGLIVLICLFSLYSLYVTNANPLLFALRDTPTDKEMLSQWAVDNGFEYVYGDYWVEVPGIAACSDGAIEAGCWHTVNSIFQVEPFNTPQDIYGEKENEKAIYVFTEYDEAKGLQIAQERGAIMTNVAKFGEFYVYTSSQQLMQVQTTDAS